MTARHTAARSLASASFLAIALITTSWSGSARAAEASTYHECYRSIRQCQKSRCAKIDGSEQVGCVRQCNREYETCIGGAGGAGGGIDSILNLPNKLDTPTTKQRKREIHRQQTP